MAWSRLFRIYEPIYVEPTYEFYSSFEFDNVETDVRKKTVHFVLRESRHMTIVEFAIALGLYNLDESRHPQFDGHLREGVKKYGFSKNQECGKK